MRQDAGLDDLSTRELQAYGALCLASFCASAGIRHWSLDELLEHLVALLSADSLPDWERAGTRLHFVGRGDPVPDDVARAVPMKLRAEFHRITDFAIEIGITDMYGAATGNPLRSALECRRILETHGCRLPEPSLVRVQSRPLDDQWGGAISEASAGQVLDACREWLES